MTAPARDVFLAPDRVVSRSPGASAYGADPAAVAASAHPLPRQAAHRSSGVHSTPGTFRLTSVLTGTFFVRTSAQVGFQISYDQQPHSSFPHFVPQYWLGPGMQKSSHR